MGKGDAARYIRQIANIEDIKVFVCKVKSINGRICDVETVIGNAPITEVRLNANINGTGGILITPVINSDVLVVMLSPVDSFVAMFSEIDSIVIDGGANNGLVKVNEMVSWMQKVHADLLTLQTSLASHLVAGNGNPLALIFNPTTSAPVSANMQNTKIKH